MSELRYTKDDEWVRRDGETCTVGITDYAQDQLGDIVFVELPPAGKTVKQGEEMAVVESVKAAAEVYAPLDGEVTAVNEAIVEDPAKVNADPAGEGWFLTLKIANPAQFEALMDEAAYKEYRGGA